MRTSILLVLLLLLPSLGNSQARASLPIPIARSEMLVSTDWLGRHLDNPGLVILYVGDRSGYDAGHIPGARFIAFSEITVVRGEVRNELPPVAILKKVFEKAGVGDASRVILYGDRLGLLAARAWFTLDYLGHGDRAALLDGGLEKWRAESRPLSKEEPQVKAASFAPRVNPGVVVQSPAMQDLSWEAANDTAPLVLIDARPPEEYAGTKDHEGVSRRGHIPGAVSLYWMKTLEGRDDPQLLPPSELRKLFVDAGAAPGKKVVSYCVTGVQASHTYFVAKYLGYDAVLYDGSMSEWSNAPGTPVVTSTETKK
jgi:thiosulfate/3-mercaptopyruvate sulfurtransferase